MKKLSKKQTKKLYKKVFQGTKLEEGDVIRYPYGKLLWRVRWKTPKGWAVSDINGAGWGNRYIYPKDLGRITVIDQNELLKWLLRNQPDRLHRYFKIDNKLLKRLRKIVPAPDF